MKTPEMFKNMKLVRCYKNFALYKNKHYRECFSYYELGYITNQIEKTKKVSPEKDRYF